MSLQSVISRQPYLSDLKDFCDQPGSGFMYLRGRRRVGKSWLLSQLPGQVKSACFLFSGKPDTANSETVRDFCQAWARFSKNVELLELRASALTWTRIFEAVISFAKISAVGFVLILDEIQWIATGRSGFIGALKAAWVPLEQSGRVKIIVCGSSTRFFSKFVGGENKILRGLKTRSDIVVQELSPQQVRREVFPTWSIRQVALTYLLFGGIPYYLRQLNAQRGFAQAINDAAFTADTIFLTEWQEILSLDFNRAGLSTARAIFSSLLDNGGLTASEIAEVSGLDQSTLDVTIKKLLEYNYLAPSQTELISRGRLPANRRGVRYVINDFYLNFYFRVLSKLEKLIEKNRAGLMFPRLVCSPPQSYHIPQCTGLAFEHMISKVIEHHFVLGSRLANKLQLRDFNFELKSNVFVKLANGKLAAQIDQLIVHREQKTAIVIECKWTEGEQLDHIHQVVQKVIPEEFVGEYQRVNVLVVSYDSSPGFQVAAAEAGVTVVELGDIFES